MIRAVLLIGASHSFRPAACMRAVLPHSLSISPPLGWFRAPPVVPVSPLPAGLAGFPPPVSGTDALRSGCASKKRQFIRRIIRAIWVELEIMHVLWRRNGLRRCKVADDIAHSKCKWLAGRVQTFLPWRGRLPAPQPAPRTGGAGSDARASQQVPHTEVGRAEGYAGTEAMSDRPSYPG